MSPEHPFECTNFHVRSILENHLEDLKILGGVVKSRYPYLYLF